MSLFNGERVFEALAVLGDFTEATSSVFDVEWRLRHLD